MPLRPCELESSIGDTEVALELHKLLRHRPKLYVQQCPLKTWISKTNLGFEARCMITVLSAATCVLSAAKSYGALDSRGCA